MDSYYSNLRKMFNCKYKLVVSYFFSEDLIVEELCFYIYNDNKLAGIYSKYVGSNSYICNNKSIFGYVSKEEFDMYDKKFVNSRMFPLNKKSKQKYINEKIIDKFNEIVETEEYQICKKYWKYRHLVCHPTTKNLTTFKESVSSVTLQSFKTEKVLRQSLLLLKKINQTRIR